MNLEGEKMEEEQEKRKKAGKHSAEKEKKVK